MNANRLALGNGKSIGRGQPTFVVAEIGQNHNGNLDAALALVDAAAWAGADAVKFVKRDVESDLSQEAWQAPYGSPHAYGRTYGEHRLALELTIEQHALLHKRAGTHGLVYFSTVCDLSSVAQITALEVPLLKIASRDLGNIPLLEAVARKDRPVLASTGMSDWSEVDAAVTVLRTNRAGFGLLQCTSLYPAPVDEAHLRSIRGIRRRYGCVVGFSDHTLGFVLAAPAVALGAAVIEKHFTLDRRAKGTDHACSLEPCEFAEMTRQIRAVESALGRADKPRSHQIVSVRRRLGRSLVTRTPLSAGAVLSAEMLALKCPGDGLRWSDLSRVVGRRLRRAIDADAKLTWDDLE